MSGTESGMFRLPPETKESIEEKLRNGWSKIPAKPKCLHTGKYVLVNGEVGIDQQGFLSSKGKMIAFKKLTICSDCDRVLAKE